MGFEDVKRMTKWPLHPILHLHGNLFNLLEMQYPAPLLKLLGITFTLLREDLSMTCEHMQMMKLDVGGWKLIGMPLDFVRTLSDDFCLRVFRHRVQELLSDWDTY